MSYGSSKCKHKSFENHFDGNKPADILQNNCSKSAPFDSTQPRLTMFSNPKKGDSVNAVCQAGNCLSGKHQIENQTISHNTQVFDLQGIILSESESKLKDRIVKNSKGKTKGPKVKPGTLAVSLRYGKYSRKSKVKRHSCNQSSAACKNKSKKSSAKNKSVNNKPTETFKKGKRGLVGGKAKGNYPLEETPNNCDSEEENEENSYFYRISLGHFQQNPGESGASTSKQQEHCSVTSTKIEQDDTEEKSGEEKELLELQRWGMSSFVGNHKSNDIKSESYAPKSGTSNNFLKSSRGYFNFENLSKSLNDVSGPLENAEMKTILLLKNEVVQKEKPDVF